MQRTSAKLIALSMLIDATTASKSVLCLHGRGGSASTFLARGLEPLRSATAASYGVPGRERRAVGWNYDAIDALDASGGWWTYPKGQRSYSADSYTGAEASIAAVEAELATGKYSGLLGFSQGAMLAAVVAARAATGEGDREAAKNLKFAVICAAALPAPFRPLLDRLRAMGGAPSSLPTLHCLSEVDSMNPPELGEELASCFGPSATVLWHDAGHDMPSKDKLNDVAVWMDQAGGGS